MFYFELSVDNFFCMETYHFLFHFQSQQPDLLFYCKMQFKYLSSQPGVKDAPILDNT